MRTHLLARHGEHAERVVVAQVVLGRERKLARDRPALAGRPGARRARRTRGGSAARCRRRAAASSAGARAAAPAARRGWRVSIGSRSPGCGGRGAHGSDSAARRRRRGSTRRPLSAMRAAAEQRDALAALVRHGDVVDAGAARSARPRSARAVSTSPARAGAEEVDRQPGRDRDLVVGVAGEGEGRVGQRRDEAAMADVVAVEHVVAHRHLDERGAPRPIATMRMPSALRRAVVGEQVRADRSAICWAVHRRQPWNRLPGVS